MSGKTRDLIHVLSKTLKGSHILASAESLRNEARGLE